MFRNFVSPFIAIGVISFLSVPAHATPACLKNHKPFALAEDTISWTMSAAPGSECIQGLRWSYMQIYNVSILKAPSKGKVIIVGPGFRYFADAENHDADSFTLEISGKNRFDAGKSTLEVTVRQPGITVSELPERP